MDLNRSYSISVPISIRWFSWRCEMWILGWRESLTPEEYWLFVPLYFIHSFSKPLILLKSTNIQGFAMFSWNLGLHFTLKTFSPPRHLFVWILAFYVVSCLAWCYTNNCVVNKHPVSLSLTMLKSSYCTLYGRITYVLVFICKSLHLQ